MIVILSPAKKLVSLEKTRQISLETTDPTFLNEADQLITILKEKSVVEIGSLMKLSENLSELNFKRYQSWEKKHSVKNSRASILAFNGAAYLGFDASSLSEDELLYSQNHLRILSGLYGVLKPLDKFQDYRLEMGTRLTNEKGSNLYKFWGSKISTSLNKDIKKQGGVLVNLASNEYFKAIDKSDLNARIITCNFKDKTKSGDYKTIMTFAKTARGLMSRFIIKNKLTSPENLKAFDYKGYYYSENLSSENEFTFLRD